MKKTTNKIHEEVRLLGSKMGFQVGFEVSEGPLATYLDKAYHPRIDVMWSLPISKKQRDALAFVTGKTKEAMHEVEHLPVVGIEVEASAPSTKTLMADAANLCALGAPLGIIVVNCEREANQYRRAFRAIRTLKYNFGDDSIVPLESSWLKKLNEFPWEKKPHTVKNPPPKKGRGGETRKWTHEVRDMLRKRGKAAGFIVAEPFNLSEPKLRVEAEKKRRKEPMEVLWDPIKFDPKVITKPAQYTTASEIDMAWLLPLPESMDQLVDSLTERDRSLIDHGLVYKGQWSTLPVVGFELDTNPGKHGGGGLLNLASYCVMGVQYCPS